MINDSVVERQSTNPKKRERDQPDVIEISSDDEDHKRKFLARSTSASGPSREVGSVSIMHNKEERKKLELERLTRQSVRNQPPINSTPSLISRTSQQSAQRVTPLDVTQSFQNYWNSTIKTTFNRWHPESPHAVRIEDLIGPKNRIKMALVSSYVAQLAWIHNLFDQSTRIMVIKHDPQPGIFKVNERKNMFLCHPPLLKTANGKVRAGCMHVKFFLIFYDDFCRVAIPTANAVDFDYEVIENSVWIQDFRRLSPNGASKLEERQAHIPPFHKAFQNLLKLMGVPSSYYKPMEDYDFSAAAANLVVSIQGMHPQQSSYGQLGLATELKTLGLQSGPGTGRIATLECQGSSIGSYDTTWIKNFYCCASGFSRIPSDSSFTTDSTSQISVVFPTLHTIKSSKGGPAGGGTIFCNKATWQKPGFPTHIFADAISKRLGVLMHVKMILGIFTPDISHKQLDASNSTSSERADTGNEFIQKDKIGFLYMGSHNFTPAAWGRLVENHGSNDSHQIEMSNWELGVVLPLSKNSDIEQYVPWQRPLKRYGHSGRDSKIPWMQFSQLR